MKVIKTFSIGSSVFFNRIEGFSPKDIDELCIMDRFPLQGNVLHTFLHGKDVFFYRDMDKEEFIKDALESEVPMRVGKFLVPDFAKYLGLTIDDLPRLKPLIDSIDEKHDYEKIIYNAYIANGDFYLTNEQRQLAYNNYLQRRKNYDD